ncbi:MAG: NUDIX hydrolase [Parcubacteria group bacterium GW2011_GWF2_38_76]|nr:MAG: NUDIX hydrolase [Parcubacteria group bacterium GW2011_GWF2_38_76]HBM45972.1 NUDIX hydrolase [Patescibacteria group bacterium]
MKIKSIKNKYKFTVVATDVVIFTIKDEKLQVLLIKMKKKPYEEHWAMPGGLIKLDEAVDSAAERILKEKVGIENVYLEQLYTFGEVDRDPFGRVVSVAYFALIPSDKLILKTTKEYGDISWFPVDKLPKLAYDHKEMVRSAINRLQSKLSYSNIVYSLLPKEFTLSEIQKTYEIILDNKLDKRNFRKKLFSLNLVKTLGREKRGMANRPASLYVFTDRRPKNVEIV